MDLVIANDSSKVPTFSQVGHDSSFCSLSDKQQNGSTITQHVQHILVMKIFQQAYSSSSSASRRGRAFFSWWRKKCALSIGNQFAGEKCALSIGNQPAGQKCALSIGSQPAGQKCALSIANQSAGQKCAYVLVTSLLDRNVH